MALRTGFLTLPLKDVFDYSLEDIAVMVDSTVGGVKSALSRGRSKLANARQPPEARSLSLKSSRGNVQGNSNRALPHALASLRITSL
jgi:hypothetical protein